MAHGLLTVSGGWHVRSLYPSIFGIPVDECSVGLLAIGAVILAAGEEHVAAVLQRDQAVMRHFVRQGRKGAKAGKAVVCLRSTANRIDYRNIKLFHISI